MKRRVLWAIRLLPGAAERAWFSPHPLPRRVRAADARSLEGFAPLVIPSDAGDVAAWTIGDGPLAIGVHGWGGRPAQLAPVARRLASEGYRAVLMQIPGHAGGPRATVLDSQAALEAAVADLGMPQVVFTHSYGAMVARLAFRDTAPAIAVFFAPMLRVSQGVATFAERATLAPWTSRGLLRRLRRWLPTLWPVVDDVYPAQLPGADILIVHDPADPDTSFLLAAELADRRPNTTLDPVAGAGHNRLLSDPRVLDRVTSWLATRIPVDG